MLSRSDPISLNTASCPISQNTTLITGYLTSRVQNRYVQDHDVAVLFFGDPAQFFLDLIVVAAQNFDLARSSRTRTAALERVAVLL